MKKFLISEKEKSRILNLHKGFKKGVSLLLNPQGKTGRQVEKGTAEDGAKYKQVTKYNQQGDVQKNKKTGRT